MEPISSHIRWQAELEGCERLSMTSPPHLPLATGVLLNDIQNIFVRRQTPDGFNLFYAVHTERVKAYTILRLFQVLCQFCFELHQLLFGEKTLEEPVLCPCPKTCKDFVNLRAPPVIRYIIRNHV